MDCINAEGRRAENVGGRSGPEDQYFGTAVLLLKEGLWALLAEPGQEAQAIRRRRRQPQGLGHGPFLE